MTAVGLQQLGWIIPRESQAVLAFCRLAINLAAKLVVIMISATEPRNNFSFQKEK